MRSALIGFFAAALTACASGPAFMGDWKNPNYSGPAFQNILVMGVSDDGERRRIFENEFVSQLNARGADAMPSYRYIGRDGKVPEDEVWRAVQASGAEAVIITRVARVDRERAVTPGYVSTTVVPAFGRAGFYGYYSSAWSTYTPPTTYEYEIYTLETNLWDIGKDQLVWSGSTRIISPTNIYKDIADLVKLITEALTRQNLI
jgi:hypothetical protein